MAWLQSAMALSLSRFPFNSKQRMLRSAASSRPLYRPDLIARVHAAIASSPDAVSHVSTSLAAAGVAASKTAAANPRAVSVPRSCLLYTSDAADERSSVDLGGRRI